MAEGKKGFILIEWHEDDMETLKEHRDLMDDVITGDYKPDSFTNQPLNILIDRIENGD